MPLVPLILSEPHSGENMYTVNNWVVGPERDLQMADEPECRSLECEISELRDRQKELLQVVQMLFDLLEDYAPSWYTEEHHKRIADALRARR